MTLFLTMLLACKDQATIDENEKLKLRVADLERTNDRLAKDNDALKIQVDRVKKDEDAAKAAEAAKALGVSKVTFKTSEGDIHCTFRLTEAPETIKNFVQLARGEKEWTHPKTKEVSKKPLYDGTIFHRVIPEFMIQGGDPLGSGMGGPGYEFADEVGPFTKFDKPGLLAMANHGPATNGSQFFITEGTPTHLNGKHTIFGDCSDLDVVKKIARVPADGNNKPLDDVLLKKVVIE